MTLGLVCDRCDALSPINVSTCRDCGAPLGVISRPDSVPPGRVRSVSAPMAAVPQAVPTLAHQVDPALLSTRDAPPTLRAEEAEAIRQCPACGHVMPASHHFCGNCGMNFEQPSIPGLPPPPSVPSPPASVPGTGTGTGRHRTSFFGAVQEARAKLVLIRGEVEGGVTYHLAGAEHVAGRTDGELVFAEDRLLSPRHANFFYRDSSLYVRDEGSRNGVFLRIRAPQILAADQPFLVGEQLLMLRPAPGPGLSAPDAEGTWFYGSPRRPARMHLVQLLVGGDTGLVVRCTAPTVSIGREGNHVNFPEDPFISGRHAQVTALDDGRFQLEDLRSKNGTFVRVRGEARLEHGDYVFLGQQLLRVEIA